MAVSTIFSVALSRELMIRRRRKTRKRDVINDCVRQLIRPTGGRVGGRPWPLQSVKRNAQKTRGPTAVPVARIRRDTEKQ